MSNFKPEPRKTIGPFTIFERVPKPRGMTKYFVGEEGKPDQDFGRYSVAIRYCKQRIPRPTPHIVIFADEKTAVSTSPINYTVLDGEFRHDAAAAVDPAMVAGILGAKQEPTG